jgi:hypothetical protein
MKRTALPALALGVALGLGAACSQPATTSSRGSAPSSDGLAAFETVRSVLQHPRCQNCHPRGDVPLQGDDGRPHNQNVQRGPDGKGMVGERCITCHGPANPPDSYGAHTPPGASTGWRMPKPDERLVFVGVAPGALCEQIKDPAHNGGMDMAKLRAHLDDPLVAWGWSPGFGRTPIPVPRDAFLAAWTSWASAGAPCPK